MIFWHESSATEPGGTARDGRAHHLGVTRRALFEELDRPNLNSLPAQPYCFAEWRGLRGGGGLPVGVGGRFYIGPPPSAPPGNGGRAAPPARGALRQGGWGAARTRARGEPRHTPLSPP